MADTVDDSKTFEIGLTENGNGEPEPSKAPLVALGAAAIGLYYLLRK